VFGVAALRIRHGRERNGRGRRERQKRKRNEGKMGVERAGGSETFRNSFRSNIAHL